MACNARSSPIKHNEPQPPFGGCARKRRAGAHCLLASGKTAPCHTTYMAVWHSARGLFQNQALCTPLTYQSMAARSLSSIRTPLATFSLPSWSAMGPVNTE